MMNKIANRQSACDALMQAAEKDKSIVVLCSDSRGSASLTPFAEKYPEQFVEVGIAEQNLVSIAAGLAKCGKRSFAASPASFLSTRSYEQIKVDVAYSHMNVKLVGISGGVSYGALGMTHHSLQDIAAIAAVPGVRVYLPSDRFQTKWLFDELCRDDEPAYIRLGRNPVEDIYNEDTVFESGKAKLAKQGADVLIVACGEMVRLSLDAAYALENDGVSVGVLDMYCVKPLDTATLSTAAEMAKLAYIVNVVIDEDKKTVAAFAGNYLTAHRRGCDFLLGYCQAKPKWADIVISSNGGAPLDQNLYQCVKGMTAAEATCNEGGVIIMCAECADGHGGEGFYESLKNCESAEALYDEFMATPQDKTLPDQWESQILARILMHHPVIFVSRPEMKGMIEEMKMTYAPSLEAALGLAHNMGKHSLTVIPNGISVIVRD